jgi:YVTN family beta-propeller protein
VTAVSVDGATNNPTGNPGGPDGEVMLDIEVAGALAPKAAITVYFAPNSSQGFVDELAAAIRANPTAISISWGSSEDAWDSATANATSALFTNAANLGITVCAAAGDHGADDGMGDGALHCVFPASHPYVLACGGTSLTGNTSNSNIIAETVWNDSDGHGATGGGISDQWGIASYQATAGVPVGRAGPARGVPDVAGCADPETGYQVRVDGASYVIGGTSAVAPLWAALACRLVQRAGKRFGLIHTSLYAGVAPGHSPAGFNDITSGNDNGQYGGYNAGPGWDPCTGLGTPNGNALLVPPSPHPVVHVANGGDNTVKIYDPVAGTIAASIAAGPNPFEIAVNPAGTQAWVSDASGSTVTIIDTASRAVTGTVTITSGASPAAVVFTPDGATAYVSDSGNGTIAVVSTASGTVTSTITVGGDPRDSAVTPDGSTVYVADHSQGVVYAISTATHTVTATITLTGGSYPAGLAISPDGSLVYAANNGSANVSVISTATNTVTATIPVGDHPNSVAFTPSGAAAYVVNGGGNTVSVISTATGTVTATIPVGAEPLNVAFNPAGTIAYVTNYNDNTVSVISTATKTVTGTATGFASPRGITIALH